MQLLRHQAIKWVYCRVFTPDSIGTKSVNKNLAIANRSRVSCINTNRSHNLATSVTPVCRCLHSFCGWRHLATSGESKTHFGLLWVRPWVNRGKCHMDEKRIQCLSNASSMYPSIFNDRIKVSAGPGAVPKMRAPGPLPWWPHILAFTMLNA